MVFSRAMRRRFLRNTARESPRRLGTTRATIAVTESQWRRGTTPEMALRVARQRRETTTSTTDRDARRPIESRLGQPGGRSPQHSFPSRPLLVERCLARAPSSASCRCMSRIGTFREGERSPAVHDRQAKCARLIQRNAMFGFYSNRLGCIGSIAVSLIGTAILALAMWALNGH
jgi:hypothetical protein